MKSIADTVKENRTKLDSMPTAYQLKVSDVWELTDNSGTELTEATMNAIQQAYEYGFIKGQRYEKNSKK